MSTHPTHKYDYLVFIGRFQPFHWGHKVVLEHALSMSDKVIVLVGSANRSRSTYNPWTFEERKNVIEQEFYGDKRRLFIFPQDDFMYNDPLWVKQAQITVKNAIIDTFKGNSENVTLHGLNDIKVGLIGCSKDHTSFYLKLFPQWDSVNIPNYHNLDATTIRNSYFTDNEFWADPKVTPPYVHRFLQHFKFSTDYSDLVDEQDFVEKYKSAWGTSPYPPIFTTVDAVVIQSGHILMVKRKARPGKGQFALPGGFVHNTEKLEDAVIRELREETKIKVPDPVLRGSIKLSKVFDDPHRSTRGRTITHAYLFNLKNDTSLPKVKGSDDAEKAFWLPLADVIPEQMFEDHYFIIQNMVGEV